MSVYTHVTETKLLYKYFICKILERGCKNHVRIMQEMFKNHVKTCEILERFLNKNLSRMGFDHLKSNIQM